MDIEASRLLYSFNPHNASLFRILGHYYGKNFTVVGPSGGTFYSANDNIVIVADSAIGRVQGVPHIIVTDLDGNVPEIVKRFQSGSLLVIHAHGDNMDSIKSFVPLFHSSFIGTSQVPGEKHLTNLEGFTDGDRAVKLADLLGAETIRLDGFNFKEPVKKEFSTDKTLKLQYAEILIREVVKRRTGTESPNIPEVF